MPYSARKARSRVAALSRRNLVAYAALMVVSLPIFELAFFHDRMWLAVVPIGAVLAWRGALLR